MERRDGPGVHVRAETLTRDWIARIGLLAVAVYVLLYAFPIFTTGQMEQFSENWSEPPLLVLLVLGMLSGLGRSGHTEERRFWGLLAACFAFWFTGTVLNSLSIAGDAESYVWLEPAVDSLFLLSYLACFLAVDQRPHLESGWSRRDVSYAFSSLGTLLFVAALVTYFFVFPFIFQGGSSAKALSTYVLIITLDALLAFRLFVIGAECPDPWWRRAYVLLGLASCTWLVTDALEWMIRTERIELAYGTPWDWLWYLPFLTFLFVRRSRDVDAWCETTLSARRSAMRPADRQLDASILLLVYAFLFPVIHLALNAAGLAAVHGRYWREALVLFSLLAFVALTVGQQRMFARRNRELRSAISVLVTNEQLQQAQKMEAIGRLAGGVAHDFNNLLTVIHGNASLLLKKVDERERIRPHLDEISKAAERASWLTRQLLAFSRGQVLQAETVDITDVIRDAETMLRRLLGAKVKVATEIALMPATVKVDRGQLLQVILNLAVNARDAMPQGGGLTFGISRQDLDEPDTGTLPPARPGSYVLLSATDTGCGMDEETRAQIFEPFFTGKPGGVGLGLATVYGIVAQSNGFIRVSSTAGEGTTFGIYLPRAEEEAVPEEKAQPEAVTTAAAPRPTVLLVEDDSDVRHTTRQLLDALGYEVIDTGSGEEALKVFRSEGSGVDLLITDIVMPGINGWQLADRLKSEREGLRVLYVSGYSEAEMGKGGVLGSRELFLQKPFALADLKGSLDLLLEAEVTAEAERVPVVAGRSD